MTTPLNEWWLNKATEEVNSVVPKTLEYGAGGSANFVMHGQALSAVMERNVSHAEAIELACAVYLHSKVSRWLTALANGQRASDDTLHDIACYLKIAQRTRETGDWPS